MSKENKIVWTGHAHSTIRINSHTRQENELVKVGETWGLKINCIGGFVIANVGDTIYFDGIDTLIEKP